MAAKNPVCKYNEAEYLNEVRQYIEGTYSKHYAGKNDIQAFDLILATGHAKSFCVGNIIKYASRLGKKDGWNKQDITKMIHYSIMLLHALDNDE